MPTQISPSSPHWLQRNFSTVSIAVGAIFTVGAVMFFAHFPFRRQAMVRRAELRTGAKVDIEQFRQRLFPPGFAATKVRLTARDGDVLTVDSVDVEGSYTGLIGNPTKLKCIHVRGLHLTTSLKARSLFHIPGDQPEAIAVEEIRVDNAVLSIPSGNPEGSSMGFLVHSLVLRNVAPHKLVAFRLFLHNPQPAGDIRLQGEFGPLDAGALQQTAVSGAFTFQNVDLAVHRGVSGTLNASGTLSGDLRHLLCKGTADVPRFQVFGSSHSVHIASQFEASVDALSGNAVLSRIVAHFQNTTVEASGTVVDEPEHPGKRIALDAQIRNGRVEDILLLFSKRMIPAMEGSLGMSAKVTVPAGPPGFLTRLKMDGQFAITDGRFTSEKAQVPIDRLSASALANFNHMEREPTPPAPVEIRGSVVDRNGIAKLRGVVFSVPEFNANSQANSGYATSVSSSMENIRTAGKLADTTSEVKSLMLRAMRPCGRRRLPSKPSRSVFRAKLRTRYFGLKFICEF